MSGHPQRDGFVLVVVLVFALLLAASVATFARRAVVDAMIVRNRDAAARAEALARGGLRLATALLIEDRLQEQIGADGEFRSESGADVWATARALPIETDAGDTLRLEIYDAGARLNLNALFENGEPIDEGIDAMLDAILERVIDAMPGRPEEKFYDRPALVRNLIDYIDADEASPTGEREEAVRIQPPYRTANRPLLSLDELRQVEGFDAALVEALRPYVTVYPYVGGGGINPNTADPHVLSLLYLCEATGSCRLATESDVRDVLRARQDETLLCATGEGEACTAISEVIPLEILPAPAYESDVFTVRARATAAGIARTLEAVVDRTDPSQSTLLAWQLH
ncbi:MAG: type II secretion system minor pseudopilin GspK [Deltaproteobacteria bacterium]|nr:MAG: type II secretion system minor pseudopilin GspK [Deltaproteobacteria bacterium]